MTDRVWVQATGRRIEPFDDPIGDVPIANRPLSEWQDRMLAGFERVQEAPCLVVPDNLYSTAAMLRRFVQLAEGRNAVAVLADSLYASSSTPVQPGVTKVEGGHRFDAVRYLSGGDEAPREIVLDPEEHRVSLPLPKVFGGTMELGLPRHPLMTMHHWVHILWANQAAAAVEARTMPWWRWVPRVLWAIVRACSINHWRVLARLNTIGRNCDIHPTAVIEGSTLGDNVSVGPHARVILSRLGNGVSIMTGAEVEACTLGDHATVAQRTGLRLCVLYPGAFASQPMMQACVLGRNVLTTLASYSLDLNLDQDIRVLLDGQLHSTCSRFLGSAFGHESRIGAGVWVASGRSVPNGTTAIRHPDLVARRFDDSADEGPWVVHEGTLKPLSKVERG